MGKSNPYAKASQNKHFNKAAQVAQRRAIQGKHELKKLKRVVSEDELFLELQKEISHIKSKLPLELWEGTPLEGTLHFILSKIAENAINAKNSPLQPSTSQAAVYKKAETKVQNAYVRRERSEQQAIYVKLLLLALLANQMRPVETKKQSTSSDANIPDTLNPQLTGSGYYAISRFPGSREDSLFYIEGNGQQKPVFPQNEILKHKIAISVLTGDVETFKAVHGHKKHDIKLPKGGNLFHIATHAMEILKELAQYYDINALDDEGYTSLHKFGGKNEREQFEYLTNRLSLGANPNTEDKQFGFGALEYAIIPQDFNPVFQRKYVKALLEKGAKTTKPHKPHQEPLALCVIGKRDDLFQLILPYARKEDPDVEKRILFVHLYGGKLEALRFLAKQGIDLNQVLKNGKTAIELIVGKSIPSIHPQALETLVELGADINALNENHFTVLHDALLTYRDDLSMVEELLRLGASPAAYKPVGKFYHTPFELVARWENFPKYLGLFVDYNFDINSDIEFTDGAMPALVWAVLHDEMKLAKLFLDYGAVLNINVTFKEDYPYKQIKLSAGTYTLKQIIDVIDDKVLKDFYNNSLNAIRPRFYADGRIKTLDNQSTVRLKGKADFENENHHIYHSFRESNNDGSIFQDGVYPIAVEGVGNAVVSVYRIGEKAYIKEMNFDNDPVAYEVYLAVLYQDLKALRSLHKNFKVNKEILNKNELLYYASFYDNHAILKFLIDQRYDVNYKGARHYSFIHGLAMTNKFEIIRKLISEGVVDVNARNVNGFTALHMAADKWYIEVIRALATDKKLDINIRNAEGKSALDIAREKGSFEVFRELKMLENGNTTPEPSKNVPQDEWLSEGVKKILYLFAAVIFVVTTGIFTFITEFRKKKNKSDKITWETIEQTISWNASLDKLLPDNGRVMLIDGNKTVLTKENYHSLKNEINTHYRNDDGRNLLHYGAITKNVSLVEDMLKEDIHVDSKDFFGITPLSFAFLMKNYEIIRLLLSHGADPLSPSLGKLKPIYFLLYTNDLELVFYFFKCPVVQNGEQLSEKKSYAVRREQVMGVLKEFSQDKFIGYIKRIEDMNLENERRVKEAEKEEKRIEAQEVERKREQERQAQSKKEQERDAVKRKQEELQKLGADINSVKEKITSLLELMYSEKTNSELTALETNVKSLKAELSDDKLDGYKKNGIQYGLKSPYLTRDLNKLKRANAALDDDFYVTYLEKLEQFKTEYEALKESTEELSVVKTSLDDLYGRLVTYKSGFNDVTLKNIKKKRDSLSKDFTTFKSEIDSAAKAWNQKNQENKNKEEEKKKALEAEKERQRQELEKLKKERKNKKGKAPSRETDTNIASHSAASNASIKLSKIESEFLNGFMDDLLLLENIFTQKVLSETIKKLNGHGVNINIDSNTVSFFGLCYYLMRSFQRLDFMNDDRHPHLKPFAPFEHFEGTAWRNRFMHYFYCLFAIEINPAHSSGSSTKSTLNLFDINVPFHPMNELAKYFVEILFPQIKNLNKKMSINKLSMNSCGAELLPKDFQALQKRSKEDNEQIDAWINDNASIILEYIIEQAESFYIILKKSIGSEESYRCLEGIFKGLLYMIGQSLRERKIDVPPYLRCFIGAREEIAHRYDKEIIKVKEELGNIKVTMIDEVKREKLHQCGMALGKLRDYIHNSSRGVKQNSTPAALMAREYDKRREKSNGRASHLVAEGSASSSTLTLSKNSKG